jgi:KDO2-lipid IV(A) lauroyltransferase
MGDVHQVLSPGKAHALSGLLDELLGPCEETFKRRAIQEYFRNHYVDRLMIFIFPHLTRADLEEWVILEGEGRSYLDEALAKQKGVVLVHGHFGPIHLPLVALSLWGYRMKQIGLPSDEGLSWVGRHVAFRLRCRYEAKLPAEVLYARSFMRPAFRWLGENGVIMVTGDGTGTEEQVGKHADFPFLGRQIPFPLGPASLALKTGAELLPLFIRPGDGGGYRIEIEEPIRAEGSNEEKILKMTGRFVELLEGQVRACPGYMHFLDRYATNDSSVMGSL